jgi:hypothetical protein
VETAGDGTGEFIWPRAQGPDGKWWGHFRAQYYNDPQDIDSSPIQRNLFQYYDQNFLSRRDYTWFFKRDRLNVVAAVDFAYSTGKASDSTSIVVLGVDGQQNYYILEIDRFKTDKISEYFSAHP